MVNSTERPNIVFVLADQLRPDFLSCYGAEFVETPNIDRVARSGVRYANAFAGSPLCVPARTSLLTGMNGLSNGVLDNDHGLRADHGAAGIPTWPSMLDEEGFYTAAVGKMHFYPWDARHGFRYRVAAEDKRWPFIRDDYDHFLRQRSLRKRHASEFDDYLENYGAIVNHAPREETPDGFVGDEACRFIDTYANDGPFALMVGFPGPHCPYDPHPSSLDRVDEARIPSAIPAAPGDPEALRRRNIETNALDWNGIDYSTFPDWAISKVRAHYAGLILQLDHEVGRILERLEHAGLLEDTVIIISSEHGDYLGDHDLIGKGTFYESALRIPLIVQSPGVPGGRVIDEMVELTDVTASLLTYGGRAVPEHMDAQPLPGLHAGCSDRGRKLVFGYLQNCWMVRDDRWKLHKYDTGDCMLFDLDSDPNEQHNLADTPEYLSTFHRLDGALTREVMRSIQVAMSDRKVGESTNLWSDADFGRPGNQPVFPRPLG